MRFERLDLNLLVAFDALLTERNVSVAANKLCLSQSTMSGALNRLREYFEDQLLVPTGRRMVLTPRAEQLAAPVRSALLQIRTTITTKPNFDPVQSDRHFTIIASDYATMVLLAEGLRTIAAEAPSMTFDLKGVDASAATRLDRGEADLLITLERYVSPDHPCAPLFADDYVVVAWSENALIGSTLTPDDYYSLGHVMVDLGPQATLFDASYVQSAKRLRRVEMIVPAFAAIPYLVVGTQRIATMHRRLAELYAASMPLKILPAPLYVPPVKEVVQWHRLREADLATVWVRDRIIAAARS